MCQRQILLIMDLGFFSARLRMLHSAQRDFMFAPLFLKSNLSSSRGGLSNHVGARHAVPLRNSISKQRYFLYKPFLLVVDLIATYGQGQVHVG